MRVPSPTLRHITVFLSLCSVFGAHSANGQGAAVAPPSPIADSVVRQIYTEGMQHSQLPTLAHALFDSIGPRLTGSPANRAANAWLARMYTSWGIPVRNEQYGTWRDWTRGASHLDLVTPRVRTLEGTALAWSPATPAGGVTGEVVALPPASETRDSAGFAHWLTMVRGKFVLFSEPPLDCRPETSWKRYALPATYQTRRAARDSAHAEWNRRTAVAGRHLRIRLDAAGVAGLLTSEWPDTWGVEVVQGTTATTAPSFAVGCEDYSLLARLVAHDQHPRLYAVAETYTAPTETPVYNTIAEMKGSVYADQYVMLSAHQDSWDSGSGATDNGTGTIVMLEAMRLLKQFYPHPKRTILVGHWSGEEEGEFGSNAFAEDHPEILRGLQALFNQDNGTGRVTKISSMGLLGGPAALTRWMAPIPTSLTDSVWHSEPGEAQEEDSDDDAFACRDAPAFDLHSLEWDYDPNTWHTNRDTYDKLSFDDLERAATLTALLAYEASEDPQQVPRARHHYKCPFPIRRSWKDWVEARNNRP